MADRQYELVYILPPDTTEQQATETDLSTIAAQQAVRNAPAASARANVAMTVSPAPVTSVTSSAPKIGMCAVGCFA